MLTPPSIAAQLSSHTRVCDVSFEFFPPKNDQGEADFEAAVARLAALDPVFVSVTYGAGGSTQNRTLDALKALKRRPDLKVAGHLTCIGASRGEIDDVARSYWQAGITHIVALRGDAPKSSADAKPHKHGYGNAAELVAGLKRIADFEISVAAYPEVHPEAASPEADLDNLKRKIDAGAARAITQFFFDPEIYFRFLDRALGAGIEVAIVPGILPVRTLAQVQRFAALCGANVPAWLAELFAGLEEDPETRRTLAAAVATEQCRQLADAGVKQFHFYTLNRADPAVAVCRLLGR